MSSVAVNGTNGKHESSSNGAIPARYPSKCHCCGKFITPGEMVRPFSRGKSKVRWQHVDCASARGVIYKDREDAGEAKAGPVAAEDRELRRLVQILAQEVEELKEKSGQVRTIEIKQPGGETKRICGAVHPAFDEVLELAAARKNIFLPGPAGCGKSHLARQVAEALGLQFGFVSCSAGMSESQLLGRMVPAGEGGRFVFLGTSFLDCYENGGVFLFDEMDAADPNVLLVINSAIANGHLAVPNRHDNPVATRHPDFICIAAANTFGRGADRQYCGRNQLDESTLDRFRIGTVPMDYDESLERQLCPNVDLYERIVRYRQAAQENRLERVVSTRFMIDAYDMATGSGWTFDRIESKLFAGWRADEIARVKGR